MSLVRKTIEQKKSNLESLLISYVEVHDKLNKDMVEIDALITKTKLEISELTKFLNDTANE